MKTPAECVATVTLIHPIEFDWVESDRTGTTLPRNRDSEAHRADRISPYDAFHRGLVSHPFSNGCGQSAPSRAARRQEHKAGQERPTPLSLSVGSALYDPEAPNTLSEILETAGRRLHDHPEG